MNRRHCIVLCCRLHLLSLISSFSQDLNAASGSSGSFFFLIMWHFLSPHPHPSRLRWTQANHFVYQGCRDNRRNVPHLELTLGDFSALVVNYSSVCAFLCIFNPYTYINIYKIIHSIITMILTVEHFMYHALVLLIFTFLSWFVCLYMDLCFKLSTHCEALKLVSLSIEVASKNKTKKKHHSSLSLHCGLCFCR